MEKEIKIQFNVTGSITQTVKIVKEDVTPEEIVKKLNSNEYVTTVFGEKPMVVETSTFKPIAEIINTDNECEYTEFEIY